MQVEWSDFACDDLDNLVQYIHRDSAFYAQLFGEKIVLATQWLMEFPESGRMIPEADNDKTLREIIVQGYHVMYRKGRLSRFCTEIFTNFCDNLGDPKGPAFYPSSVAYI